MKNIIFSLLCLSVIMLASCQKDDAPETNRTRILGKWKVEKVIDEYYQPVNTLIDREETTGNPDEYIEFTADGKVKMHSPSMGDDETTYEFIDEDTIMIEDEVYDIKELVEAKLHLFQDFTEGDQRFVQNAYFIRL
ncbi:MAG TPA: hypothetical protein VD996_15845 [Chitinophagaceae bacterium]|nr:hypothetical protein [Chitinophagaceae bacterium]